MGCLAGFVGDIHDIDWNSGPVTKHKEEGRVLVVDCMLMMYRQNRPSGSDSPSQRGGHGWW